MNVLTMQDVRKSFGSLEVLKGISLTVGEGRGRLGHRPQRQRQIDAPALRDAA